MGVPKRKPSRSRQRMRRAYNSVLKLPQLSTCPQCAAPYVPHRVCPACGFYSFLCIGFEQGIFQAEIDFDKAGKFFFEMIRWLLVVIVGPVMFNGSPLKRPGGM